MSYFLPIAEQSDFVVPEFGYMHLWNCFMYTTTLLSKKLQREDYLMSYISSNMCKIFGLANCNKKNHLKLVTGYFLYK